MENQAELATVLSEYGFMQGRYLCSKLPSGTANKNYIVQKDGEHYILRLRNPKYSGEGQIKFEEEYLTYVKSRGIPVPTPLKNTSGESWVHSGVSVYQLYSYIDGSPFEKDNLEQIRQAGIFLGRLHRALSHFSPVQKHKLPRYDHPLNILNAVKQTFQDPSFEINENEREKLAFIAETSEQLLSVIPDAAYHQLYHLCIHGDYHPANVKYRNNIVCGLFDFDWISIQPRLRDIVDGIAYFSAIREKEYDGADIFSLTQPCRFDFTRIKLFVTAYQNNCYRPLDENEMAMIPFFIKSRLLHSRVEALAKIPASRRVEMLTTGITETLEWIDGNYKNLVECLQ